MDIRRALLARIEGYLATTGMATTTFGRLAVNDGNFVRRLRDGRGLTARTHARIEAFMRGRSPAARSADPGARPDLARTIRALKAHRSKLQAEGILHVAVFGSVARNDASVASDVDLLIEIAPKRRVGLFQLARLKRQVTGIVPNADVVDRSSLHPAVAERIAADAVYAF